ncbi:sucrose-6-phosphate hydrolase [Lacticaseibacillus sp. 53-4]|uniref:sucrose-6-phosphate hydrolase n=1 Tax=Lacticaseibacillus sp. 53-4 TaxID=2799575 RepID=UPI0019457AC2|nr:sucrose-6-phosphate hydrolase [Lacticaseibacillus sp. 53-4]
MNEKQKWTQKQLYLPYEEWPKETRTALKKMVSASPWRTTYHIEPSTGLLNDPNGFTFFDGHWQLSYQSFPYGPVHGLKSWHRLTSPDLVHWQDEGDFLLPDSPYDAQGVYSGSAISLSPDILFIMYTGNVRTADWKRKTYQNGALMNRTGEVTKMTRPLIQRPDNLTEHFRDPMLFMQRQNLYVLIGGQSRSDHAGIMLLFRCTKNIRHWTFVGNVNAGISHWGYMVECPNFVVVDHHPVLIFSPQGLDQSVLCYDNRYPTVYLSGTSFDASSATLNDPTDLHLLDEGFDNYATQAFNSPDGRTLSISWIGMPETSYPTDDYGYDGALSLVNELKWQDGRLIQSPVKETLELRKPEKVLNPDKTYLTTNSYELHVHVQNGEKTTLSLFDNPEHTIHLQVTLDTIEGVVTIDRQTFSWPTDPNDNQRRLIRLESHQAIDITIFADISIFECYINGGAHRATGRVFPDKDGNGLSITGHTRAKYFEMKK